MTNNIELMFSVGDTTPQFILSLSKTIEIGDPNNIFSVDTHLANIAQVENVLKYIKVCIFPF